MLLSEKYCVYFNISLVVISASYTFIVLGKDTGNIDDVVSEFHSANSSTLTNTSATNHTETLSGNVTMVIRNTLYIPEDDGCFQPKTYQLIYLSKQCPTPQSLYSPDLRGSDGNRPPGKRVICLAHPSHISSSSHGVRVFNSTTDDISDLILYTPHINSSKIGHCSLLLFYATHCPFSAALVPHYNALARAFPNLYIVAVDAFVHKELQYKFGSFAVPHIIFLFNGKHLMKFNYSEPNIETLSSFITDVTGMKPSLNSFNFTNEDLVDSFTIEFQNQTDYVLWLAWIFVLCYIVRSDIITTFKERFFGLINL